MALRPHAARPADRRVRRRRRPRPRQAPADGRHRRRASPTSPSSPTTIRARRTRPRSAPRSWPARRACARSATAARRSAPPPRMLSDGDVLVVAGKGHEQGQTVGAIDPPVRRRRRDRRGARPGAGAWLSRSGPPTRSSPPPAAGWSARRSPRPASPSTPARSSPATCSSPWPASATATSSSPAPWPRARRARWRRRPVAGPAVDRRRHAGRRWSAWASRPASGRRRRARGAVTGSVGKTSVTQAIARRPGARRPRPTRSVKSYNNHIGVPLTLARMPRDTERAVFEIGMNHAGEITPLSRMVAPAGGGHHQRRRRCTSRTSPTARPGVARAKAEIFEGLQPGGVGGAERRQPLVRLPQGRRRDGARRAGAHLRLAATAATRS